MRKVIFFSIALLVTLFGVSFMSSCSEKSVSAKTNYDNFCMGCHLPDRGAFINRTWLFGSSEADVIKSIKYGQPDIGMPGFEKAFSEKEIRELAHYIMGKEAGQKTDENKNIANIVHSQKQKFVVDTVVSGLDIPWGMTWLPNGDMLINERSGKMYRFSNGKMFGPIEGVPEVFNFGQGGLLDIELHPNYTENGWIYITYSHPAPNATTDGGNTAVMRFRLKDDKLYDKELLFVGTPFTRTGPHFGSRLEFDRDGFLYFTIGDRGNKDNAQLLSNTNGKVHRINDDGSIPADNPFINTPGASKTIYNFGHRNIQGLALHPETGLLWSHEHGPRGGDEINIERGAVNYGWPVISFGINYDGTILTNDTAKAGMEQPVIYYVPSIAPCGMDFVEGDRYPNWKNNMLVGSLRFKYVERVEIVNNRVVAQEKLVEDIGRVRNVKMGSDGYIYIAIERPGKIVRLIPVD
jgi:aldose sugar dehydrogenase